MAGWRSMSITVKTWRLAKRSWTTGRGIDRYNIIDTESLWVSMKDESFARKKWVVPYRNIVAVSNGHGLVDIVEQSNCFGGSCWAEYHYRKSSPLIIGTK